MEKNTVLCDVLSMAVAPTLVMYLISMRIIVFQNYWKNCLFCLKFKYRKMFRGLTGIYALVSAGDDEA